MDIEPATIALFTGNAWLAAIVLSFHQPTRMVAIYFWVLWMRGNRRPLVVNQWPTGYISEIGNLAPACGKRNQSKGNKPWRIWMEGTAPQSPKIRGVLDLDIKISRLLAYEQWRPVEPLNFEEIVGAEVWERH